MEKTGAEIWLEEVGESPEHFFHNDYILMERYANALSRGWQAAILEFRNKILLNGGLTDFSILRKFDEHFMIEEVRSGE